MRIPLNDPAAEKCNSSMQLTRAADYAVRVMVHLATLPPEKRAFLPDLAEATSAPESFLSKVMQTLSHAELDLFATGKAGRLCDSAPRPRSHHARSDRSHRRSHLSQRLSQRRQGLRAQILVSCSPRLGACPARHDRRAHERDGLRHGLPKTFAAHRLEIRSDPPATISSRV